MPKTVHCQRGSDSEGIGESSHQAKIAVLMQNDLKGTDFKGFSPSFLPHPTTY